MPANKSDGLRGVDAGRLWAFHSREYAAGHRATRFDNWREATEPYSVNWQPNFEPYVLVNREDAPAYNENNENLVGFGGSKASFIEDLHKKGAEFIIAPDCYLVHYPHGPSRDLVVFRRNKEYQDYISSIA